jgi:hypothetical protein
MGAAKTITNDWPLIETDVDDLSADDPSRFYV